MEVDYSLAQIEGQRTHYESTKFLHNIVKKKKIDAPTFQYLTADCQLLIYVADAISPTIRYLW